MMPSANQVTCPFPACFVTETSGTQYPAGNYQNLNHPSIKQRDEGGGFLSYGGTSRTSRMSVQRQINPRAKLFLIPLTALMKAEEAGGGRGINYKLNFV